VEAQVQTKLKELQDIQVHASPNSVVAEAPVKAVLNDLLAQEEMKWRQRAKENWLRGGGDTNFFHMCANQKKHRSQIQRIKDGNGERVLHRRQLKELSSSTSRSFLRRGRIWRFPPVWLLWKKRSPLL
jgi:hypothetical protein